MHAVGLDEVVTHLTWFISFYVCLRSRVCGKVVVVGVVVGVGVDVG